MIELLYFERPEFVLFVGRNAEPTSGERQWEFWHERRVGALHWKGLAVEWAFPGWSKAWRCEKILQGAPEDCC